MNEKLGDWGIKVPSNEYEWGYTIKLTTKHKIRHAIGITGSITKNGKKYYTYGLVKQNFTYMDRLYHRFLRKITPLLNKIL